MRTMPEISGLWQMDVNSFDRAASAANAFAVSLEDMAKVLRQFMSPFTI